MRLFIARLNRLDNTYSCVHGSICSLQKDCISGFTTYINHITQPMQGIQTLVLLGLGLAHGRVSDEVGL
jgi:hypothetical protein